MPTFFCCWMFIFDNKAIMCHQWWMKSQWLKKHMYEYQQCVKWYSWSILIIFYVLYSEKGHHCNAKIFLLLDVHIWHTTKAIICGHWWFLMESKWLRWKKIIHGYQQYVSKWCSWCILIILYYFVMSCIQKVTIAPMPTIILLLNIHIWQWGHHFSLVIHGVKVTEGTNSLQNGVLVHIDHTLCPVFRKSPFLLSPHFFAVGCSYLLKRPSFVTGD
jgi:hypothetical protein